MSYSLKIEREILTYVLDWQVDDASPGGDAHFGYPDVLSQIPSLVAKSTAEAQENYRQLTAHVRILQQRGLVGGDYSDMSGTKYLTNAGHERLDWHREQEIGARLSRFGKTAIGVVVINLLLPALVALVTVLLTNKFGIDGNAP